MVVGRRVISLKVSVSPGRDIETLLKQSTRPRKRSRAMSEALSPATSSGKSSPTTMPSGKRRSNLVEGSGKYNVVVCLVTMSGFEFVL